MVEDHLLLFLSWTVYYVIHSVLITDSVKLKLQASGISLDTWRLIYALVSIIGLLVISWHLLQVPTKLFLAQNTVTKFLGMVFATYGVIVIRISFRNYSLRDFITRDRRFIEEDLIVEGIHKKIRHPLYAGTILIFLGFVFFVPKLSTLVVVATSIAYVFIGIQLEESKLIKKFGDQYIRYKEKVPMIIPRLFGKE